MVIAIDGPAGVGKSSIAKMIAGKMGIFYLNSGNFYRAVTLKLLRKGISPENQEEAVRIAENTDITVNDGRVFMDGEDVEDLLHCDEVDAVVAPVSAIVGVRLVVNNLLRRLAGKLDRISEGRDITTVVFPDADYKFYFDASADARAARRFEQGVSNLSLEEIRQKIIERDNIDINKSFGGLKISKDSIYIDTTDLTIDQVYEKVLFSIKKK